MDIEKFADSLIHEAMLATERSNPANPESSLRRRSPDSLRRRIFGERILVGYAQPGAACRAGSAGARRGAQ